jgi:dTDP-4-amino-4,6-dideoxygalactose transaminase
MWNESRREHARKYNELFATAETNIITPFESPRSKAVYHLYVLEVENREAVQAHLAKENIDTGIHYPVPLHLQKAYSSLGYEHGAFPVSEKAAERIVSLPMFPGITEADQARVVHAVVQSAQCTGPQNVLVR